MPILVLAAIPSGHAEAQRFVWEHDGGSFKDQGGYNWVEQSKVGSFKFKETTRCADYVELQDGERGTTVRLFADATYVKGGSFKDFTKYYKGHWSAKKRVDARLKSERLFTTEHYHFYIEGPDADDKNQLYIGSPKGWQSIANEATDVAAGGTSVWCIGPDGDLFVRINQTWEAWR
jgi:hypothetical protein